METENLTNLTDVTLEFRTGAIEHTLVTGLELSRETTEARNSAQTTNQPQILDFFNPDPNQLPFGAMPVNSGNPSETEIKSIGLYAVDTIKLTDQWAITAGLRRDDVDVDYEYLDAAEWASGIKSVELERESGRIVLERPTPGVAVLTQPGQPSHDLSFPRRTLRECLAEELRGLDPDVLYGRVITKGWELLTSTPTQETHVDSD